MTHIHAGSPGLDLDFDSGCLGAMTAFVPALAERLVDRFGLSPVAAFPSPGEQTLHDPNRAHRVWRGPAGLDDGYAFIGVLVEEFGLRPDPRCGERPFLVEALRVHDPRDNPPDDQDRLFSSSEPPTRGLRLRRPVLDWTKADAVADAGGRR